MSTEGGVCLPSTNTDENKCQAKMTPEQKGKKKINKVIESILREIPAASSTEEKLHLLCHKFHALSVEQKDTLSRVKQLETTIKSACHERDQLQNERNRLILQKEKLETLCREVQKHSKIVESESLARTHAEEEKRREVSDHFQTSITGIQKQLNEYQTRNSSLHKENQELAEKLKLFIEQHDMRESHINKLMETRSLEVKLGEAKLQKSQCQLEKATVAHRHEVTGLQLTAKAMEDRMNAHLEVEKKLREQVDFYKVKYQEFNKAMANNNRLFDSAKSEMEKFAKRMRQYERDITEWRGKWELSQRSLLEVVDELKRKEKEAEAATKKVDRLTGLCRALQTQLSEVRGQGSQPSGSLVLGDEDQSGPGLKDLDAVEPSGEQEEHATEAVADSTPSICERGDTPSGREHFDPEVPVVPVEDDDHPVEVEKAEDTDDQSWVSVLPQSEPEPPNA